MSARPDIWDKRHAAAFEDFDVARYYRHRPPYAAAAIAKLGALCAMPRVVLDLGAGTGFVARRVAPLVERVDAVDASAAMIAEGRREPGGADARINWVVAAAEDVRLAGPYGLATAGDSLHWMEWGSVLPRVAQALAADAYLAIVEITDDAWSHDDAVREVIKRYSVYGAGYQPVDLVKELDARALFRRAGAEVYRERFAQSQHDFIASFHARASLSVARIGQERAQAFDRELGEIIDRDADRYLTRDVTTSLVWGTPTS